MTTHSAKLTSKGQITLPAQLRRALGLKPGDEVTFVKRKDGEFYIRPRTHSIADLLGIVRLDKPVRSTDIDRWIEEARAARGNAKAP
jgi:AbrB family looped-hinge helix DNA binding protein